jgi:hypothetical protein
MTTLRPTPAEERWLLLASRFPAHQQAPLVLDGMNGWRSVGLVTRCAFFFLGLIAVAMTSAIFGTLWGSDFEFLTGLALLASGEWLVHKRRLHAAGVEEALMVAALVLLAVGVADAIGNYRDAPLALCITLALLIAGIRLLNPLFTTLAALCGSITVALALNYSLFNSSTVYSLHAAWWASLYCFALAITALLLGARQQQRPSHDRMLDGLVIVMPAVGYLWAALNHSFNGINYWQQHTLIDLFTPLAPLLFGIAALVTGLRRRTHAPLLSYMVCMACVAYELRELSGLSLPYRLILWGSLILITASVAHRLLRTPRNGITSQQLDDKTGVLDLAELAGSALLTPNTRSQATPPDFAAGGGSFGGGGAPCYFTTCAALTLTRNIAACSALMVPRPASTVVVSPDFSVTRSCRR